MPGKNHAPTPLCMWGGSEPGKNIANLVTACAKSGLGVHIIGEGRMRPQIEAAATQSGPMQNFSGLILAEQRGCPEIHIIQVLRAHRTFMRASDAYRSHVVRNDLHLDPRAGHFAFHYRRQARAIAAGTAIAATAPSGADKCGCCACRTAIHSRASFAADL